METLAIVGVGLVALLLLALRRGRRQPLSLGCLPVARRAWSTPASGVPRAIEDDEPRHYSARADSLIQQIDAAFDALEITFVVEEARLPSVEIVVDESPAEPEHDKFDTSDSPVEPSEELWTARTYDFVYEDAAAFAPEPTVTTVDADGISPVDELAAFLAREDSTLPPHRAARGSHHPIVRQLTVRGDLRRALPRPITHVTAVTAVSRPMRARTPS